MLEESYFREFGIFPIMHLMGIRRDVVASSPKLGRDIFDAFTDAQQLADEDLSLEQALKISLPWVAPEVRRTRDVMGDNHWPAGFKSNRHVVERVIAWSYEDGLIPVTIDASTLFEASLLDT